MITEQDVKVFEKELYKLIELAHRGDEQAMNSLDMVKEWLKNN